jgi:osmotically-inducible protein OsmY
MNDASISTAVQMKLTGDREANFARVQVDATQGVVSLNGAVTSSDDKARAERLAKSVHGVSRVRNHLQVQREPAKTGKVE